MSILVWFAAGLLVVTALVVLVMASRVASQRLWWGILTVTTIAVLLGLAAAPLHGKTTAWHWQMTNELDMYWRLDARTWSFAVIALAMLLAIALTDAARAERVPAEGNGWAGVLLAGAVAIPAVLAASPWTFGAVWAVIDIGALSADLGRLSRARHRNAAVWVAFARALTWLAAGVTAVLWLDRQHEAMLLWFGVLALRLWVAMLEPGVMAADRPPWRLAWSVVYLWSVLAAAGWASEQVWTQSDVLLGILSVLALWGVWRWQRTRTPLRQVAASGVALGGIALMASVRGLPAATWAWSLLAVFPVLGLVLAPHRRRVMWLFFVLLAGGMSLLPFTPASAAVALWTPRFEGWMVLPGVVLVGSLMALVRQGMALPFPDKPLPREKQAFCVLGMAVWTGTFWGWRFWQVAAPVDVAVWLQWVPGGAALAAALGLWMAFRRVNLRMDYAEAKLSQGIGRLTGYIFWRGYRLVGRFLRFLSLLLEGDGGVLWALVLLVMLAVLLQR